MKALPGGLLAYYDFVASQPCIVERKYGVEVAHVRVMASDRGGMMPRSHKTLAAYAVVPLTPEMHRHGQFSIHNLGEGAFELRHAHRGFLAGWVVRLMAMYISDMNQEGYP